MKTLPLPHMFSHLKTVCMTYSEHWRLSLCLATLFARGALCAIVHAFLPNVFSSSSTVFGRRITETIARAGCHDKTD